MFEKKEEKPGTICPYVKGTCIKDKCMMWMNVRGANPQTGEMMDQFGCAITWTPILIVEMCRQQRSMTAATESYRNETVGFFSAFAKMVNDMAKRPELENKQKAGNGLEVHYDKEP